MAATGSTPRLLVTEPPRHGKSELVSHAFPVWYLNRWPERRVILASYEADFASSWGRKVRNTIERGEGHLGVRIASDSSAANRWDTTGGGGMVTAGVGGPITGRGADLLVIDDPVKNAEEAESQTFRDRAWDWWTSTAYTRLEPGGVVVLLQTRWHEDDLAGRILARSGERWETVRLPAIAEEGDAIGRAVGEPLWPARYGVEALDSIRREVGPRVWSALYQQDPLPAQGNMFKREWFERRYVLDGGMCTLPSGVRVPVENLHRFATVDLAASVKTGADYTVIACFGEYEGQILVLEIDRARREGPDIVPAIERAVERWDLGAVFIEKAGFQLAIVQEATRAGVPVRELEADRDKVARALPLTAAFESGRMLLPRGLNWAEVAVAELLAFPAGAHDDQVDALAYGCRTSMKTFDIGGADTPRTSSQSEMAAGFVPNRPW